MTTIGFASTCSSACARPPVPMEPAPAVAVPGERTASAGPVSTSVVDYVSHEPPYQIRLHPAMQAPLTSAAGEKRVMIVGFERGISSVIASPMHGTSEDPGVGLDRQAQSILMAGGFDVTSATSVSVPGATSARRYSFSGPSEMSGVLVVAVRVPWAFVFGPRRADHSPRSASVLRSPSTGASGAAGLPRSAAA